MSSLIAAARSFDDVFQPGQAVPGSHPDRLAAIATLFGMRPQPIDRSRVLELGCSTGQNLLALADRHPESHFVGVEDSDERVAAVRQAADVVGFDNVDVRKLNIATVDERLGTFDYILCHDLFGRAPAVVQDRLLAICRSLLNPHGVAYSSYRTLPGWLMPGVVQELVRGGATGGEGLASTVARARKLLEFLSQWLARDDSGYGRLLKSEADLSLGMPDRWLAYEHLTGEGRPIYFHQLVDRAARHELQYLGDTQTSTMSAAALAPAAAHNVMQVARDRVSLEQHLDLLRNRGYHRSLVCHREVPLDREVSPGRLQGLFLAGNLRREGSPPEAGHAGTAQFVAPSGAVLSSPSPAVSAALVTLAAAWPRAIPFDELLEATLGGVGPDDQPAAGELRALLSQNLVACIAAGFVEPRCAADSFVTVVGARPKASRWTRALAASSTPLINRLHEPVHLDELSRNLLPYLDGQHDRESLLATLIEATQKGQLSILKSGIPASQADSAAEILDQVLDQSLAKLAASALLVA